MSVLQVLHFRRASAQSRSAGKEVNADIQRIVDDMFETMYAEEGIGGCDSGGYPSAHYRDRRLRESRSALVLINPELLETSGETGIEEGCLSIPEQRALVPVPRR